MTPRKRRERSIEAPRPTASPGDGASVASSGAAAAPASAEATSPRVCDTCGRAGAQTRGFCDLVCLPAPATPLVPESRCKERWLLPGRGVVGDKFEARITASFECERIRLGRRLLTVFEPNFCGSSKSQSDHEPKVEVAMDGDEMRIFLCHTSPAARFQQRFGMTAEHLSLLRAHRGDEGAHFLALQVSGTDLSWVRRLMTPRNGPHRAPPLYSPDDIDNDEGRKYIICEVQTSNKAQFRTTLELLLRNPRIASMYREIGEGETAPYFRSQSSLHQEEIAELVQLKAELKILKQERTRFDTQVEAVKKLRDVQERRRTDLDRVAFQLNAAQLPQTNDPG